ncbi:MAG: hypothetical protein R3E68_00085 [Burkholderiaceae bacterium]
MATLVDAVATGLGVGLLFTTSGERLIPTHTVGRPLLPHYAPAKDRHYEAGASYFGGCRANPSRRWWSTKCGAARTGKRAGQFPGTVRASAIDLDEALVVMPMRQLAAVWPSLFPGEQRRLARSC